MNKSRIINISNIFFLLLIVVVVALSALCMNNDKDAISVAENRNLATIAPMSEGINPFMESVDSYVNDRIGFREMLVSGYSELTTKVLKMQNEYVIQGDDGWLFYRDDLASYTGHNNTEENVEYCVSILKALDQWYKAGGSQFVFLVAPNKSTIYSQYMPDYIGKAPVSLMDALVERLDEEGIMYVYPKEELLAASESVEVYPKLDSHWNSYGSKYALDALLQKFELEPCDIDVEAYRDNTGDLLSMLAIGKVDGDSLWVDVTPNERCEVENIPDSQHMILHTEDAPSFICFRDSMSIALIDYYTYYFDGPVYWDWNVSGLTEEVPQYVIFECAERLVLSALSRCEDFLN